MAIAAGQLKVDSAVFRWIGCVAFAISAGTMSKILYSPSGVLADTPDIARLAGVATGLLVFYCSGRRIFRGLFGGVAAFMIFLQFY